MQLRKSRTAKNKNQSNKANNARDNIRHKLAIASSALLLSTPVTSISATKEAPKAEIDNIGISQLYYQEIDRVSVEKTQALITKEINENDILKLNFVYDTMSGASPNGRIYTDFATSDTQTITSASGNANTVATNADGSNETWKTNFEDTRTAFNAEWEHKFFPGFSAIVGGGTSKENDYESNTFSGKVVYDTNQRRTSLTAGVSFSFDTVSPFGGVPEGVTALVCHQETLTPNWAGCGSPKTISKPAQKILNDYLIGITQVWNRRTLMQFNFSFGVEDGYLTDPYKQVSLLSSQYNNEEVAVLYEKRPRERITKSIYYKIVHVPTNQTAMNISYRLYWDDWDVFSDTLDGRIRMNISPRVYVQGHARAQWQSAAYFFQPYVGADENSKYYELNGPEFVSADSRLSGLATLTAGAKVGLKINNDAQFSFRVEKMTQRYDNRLLPTMQVIITQINLTFKF